MTERLIYTDEPEEWKKLAAKTNKERHGEDFYREIGSIGGSRTDTKPKGFAYAHNLTK